MPHLLSLELMLHEATKHRHQRPVVTFQGSFTKPDGEEFQNQRHGVSWGRNLQKPDTTYVQSAGADVADDVEFVPHVDMLLAAQPLDRGCWFSLGFAGDFREGAYSRVCDIWSRILETWTVCNGGRQLLSF